MAGIKLVLAISVAIIQNLSEFEIENALGYTLPHSIDPKSPTNKENQNK